MVFAEVDVQETLSRQDVDGQAAVPKGDTQPQLALALKVKLIPVNGNFQYALEGSLSDELGIKQADKEIGRASCRERVKISVRVVSVTQDKTVEMMIVI